MAPAASIMTHDDLQVPIKNFHRVNDWLYRGGQPSMEGFASLKRLNIQTVISLRWRKASKVREQPRVTELGMTFINIPLNYWTLPSQDNVDAFLTVLDDEQNRPIFVHCYHGADRTGVLIAMFRIMRSGWSLKEAYHEMLQCGFHRFHTWHFKWGLWRLAKRAFAEGPR